MRKPPLEQLLEILLLVDYVCRRHVYRDRTSSFDTWLRSVEFRYWPLSELEHESIQTPRIGLQGGVTGYWRVDTSIRNLRIPDPLHWASPKGTGVGVEGLSRGTIGEVRKKRTSTRCVFTLQ